MTAKMTFKMEISGEDLWHYILCLETRDRTGNNSPPMKEFLHRETKRLETIHEKWAAFEALENIGVEVTSVSV